MWNLEFVITAAALPETSQRDRLTTNSKFHIPNSELNPLVVRLMSASLPDSVTA
jgi:hypothetical protein